MNPKGMKKFRMLEKASGYNRTADLKTTPSLVPQDANK